MTKKRGRQKEKKFKFHIPVYVIIAILVSIIISIPIIGYINWLNSVQYDYIGQIDYFEEVTDNFILCFLKDSQKYFLLIVNKWRGEIPQVGYYIYYSDSYRKHISIFKDKIGEENVDID